MFDNKRNRIRNIEVLTGIMIILSTLSLLASYLFNFEYTGPEHSFEEDFNFISDGLAMQRISALFWMITGILFLLLLPFYLIVFSRCGRIIHLLNGLLILLIAMLFFRSGLAGLKIPEIVASGLDSEMSPYGTTLLSVMRETIYMVKIATVAFGGYIVLLSTCRFWSRMITTMGTFFLLVAGPVIIIFTWINPEHIALTSAIAGASVGLFIAGVRLVTRGMHGKVK